MRMLFGFGPSIITAAAVLSCGAGAQPGGTWLAGTARADITPRESMWLAGYGNRDHASEGTLCPLWAKALLLQDGNGQRVLLVTTDLLGFPKAMSDAILGRIEAALGLPRARIVLNSSHTHTGPVLRDSLYAVYPLDDAEKAKIDAYANELEDRLVALASEAAARLEPAALEAGNGVTRFAVNRRNNPEAEVLASHELKGPVDHAVPVLKIVGEDGSLRAVVFGYACHATVLNSYRWSGDYPGFAQAELETRYPGVIALFFAGCGADQNPLPRRSDALAKQYGRELAAAVDCVLSGPMSALEPTLETAYAEVELALEAPPTRDELVRIGEQGNEYDRRAARFLIEGLDRGIPLPTSHPCPVHVWRLGGQTIVSIGGEVVVDYAIAIKQMLGPGTFVMGFSNDLFAYVPSQRVLREGGYEGATSQMEYGFPSKWREDIESRLLTAIRELAAAAHGL